MTERKKAARWRREPRETGLRAVTQRRGYELRIGEEVLIRVRWASAGFGRKDSGWFWYGMGENTHTKLHLSPEAAKAAADAWYKARAMSATPPAAD